MIVGFKTGPKNFTERQGMVLEDGAKLCEVWFRIDQASEYEDMLTWLAAHEVAVGLHHWGLIDGVYKTNMTSASKSIRQQTIKQIKDTIDVAARFGCVYVNAHGGALSTEKISFEPMKQELVPGPTLPPAERKRVFFEVAADLATYAQQRHILLMVETLTGREQVGDENRENFYDAGNIHYQDVLAMGRRGGYIANDIVHTASQMMMEGLTNEALWQALYTFTKDAAPFTRLIHINTVPPPFNGTDSHHGILAEDFAQGVFPDYKQIRALLQIFRGRDDVFVIPEPRDKMRENFFALQELAAEVL